MSQIIVELQNTMGSDVCVANAAWTSTYSKDRREDKYDDTEKVTNLVKMLARERHGVPFESVIFRFWMYLPIFTDRQFMTHRMGCLTADDKLWFDLPSGLKTEGRKIHKMTIGEFHRKWHEGVHIKRNAKREIFNVNGIDLSKQYTLTELAKLTGKSINSIRTLISHKLLPSSKKDVNGILLSCVSGSDFVIWSKSLCDYYQDIKPRLKNMKLRSLNESNMSIGSTNVTDIWSQGVQPVYEVTLENGYKIKSTLNHKYYTSKGWLTLGDAIEFQGTNESFTWSSIASKLSTNGEIAYKNKNYIEKLKKQGMSVSQMAEDLGISYHTVRKWLKIHGLSFSKGETYFKSGSVPWNRGKMYHHSNPYKITTEERTRKSIAASGSNSNWWKGGVTSETAKLRSECNRKFSKIVYERDNYRCQNCQDSQGGLHAHHIIPLFQDRSKAMDVDNLITLCANCHVYIHSNNLEFEFAESRKIFIPVNDRKEKPRPRTEKLIGVYTSIKDIKYLGMEETFDLEVTGPYHNFVCNGVVVHNSHNGLSGRYRTLPNDWYNLPNDVTEILKKAKCEPVGDEYLEVCDRAYSSYSSAIKDLKETEKNGIITNAEYKRAREVLRGMLPTSGMTERTTILNLRSFANFQKQRNSDHAQPEIRYIAQEMLRLVEEANICPVAIQALKEQGWDI